MPKVKISEYSATANSNTDVASINIDEGCAPSGINNAIRAVMGHLKDFQQGTNGDPFNGPVNGTVGATTPSTGAFTTLSAAGQLTVAYSGAINVIRDTQAYSVGANGSAIFLQGLDSSSINANLGVIKTLAQTSQNSTMLLQVASGGSPSTIATLSSTGLAVTGTLSSSGLLSANNQLKVVNSTNDFGTIQLGTATTYKFTGGATFSGYRFEIPSGQYDFQVGSASKVLMNAFGIGLGASTPSSGAGITFPATQSASTDANTLDDYEEGTWSPIFNSSGTAIVASYNNRNGSYTKIGNMVTVYGYIAVASVSSATGSYLRIGNLPFNCASSSGIGTGNAGGIPAGSSCVYQGFTSLSSGDVIALGAVDSATSEINMWKMNGNGSFGTGMSGANVTAGTLIYFTVTYRTA